MDLGEWDDDISDAPVEPTTPTTKDEPETPALRFATLDDFVREFVCEVFRRNLSSSGPYWSARWWASPEAVLRLEAMWRCFEELRQDPNTGISVWLRDHADVQMSALMSQQGPFGQSRDKATLDGPLPYDPPPPGLYSNGVTPRSLEHPA